MKIDKTNMEIIKHLRDGRKSFKEIADSLNLSENTVRSRVTKLTENEVLEICGLSDPEKLPGHSMVIIGIKLQSMDLVKKGKEFSRLKGVASVSVVTGRYDLIAIIMLKENFGLLEFYTDEVSKVKGIQSVESFVVYKNYNLKIPYIF